ncbi:hypothetical protein BO85DRAFT_449464 [Aspergillus piperis CBS 112811]|uniref:Uncharacterized protein n=1 Tax=Aspergillus piperis CBS 112811 TaxID=1448313 RepID=A0A8G1R1J8_9EURO|nr:hypothetical protein BO85DRAFT_449464 [Aspergillus piperis CBS 112811]RAH57482.1 hypothetical protein BO85DRAFT_449464 [Aspergillus piperis CBS 112811]
MMQSRAQQPPDPTVLTRLSLAKFSHTTTSLTHRGPLNWSHIMGNGDMTAIFERRTMTSFTPDRVLMKVLRVHESLEEIDLTHFIIEAESITQSSQHAVSKPIFAVVVKPPCLAVKYPRGNTVRRFQIKFTFDSDYYTALSILRELGCPVSEPSVGSMRKLTSSQWNSGSIEGTSMSRGPSYSLSSMPGPSEPVGASSLQRSSTTGASGSSSSVTACNSLPSTSWSTAQTSDTTCAKGTKDQAFLATAQTSFQFAPAVGQKDVTSSDIITSRPFTSSAAERLLKPEINIPPRRVLPWSSTSKRANTMTKAPPTVPYTTVTSGTSSNIDTIEKSQIPTKPPQVARSNQLGMQTQTRPATSGERTTMPRLRLLPPKLPNAKNDRQQPHPESGPNISAHTGSHNQPPCLKAVNPPVVPSYPSINCNLQAERTEASKLSTGKQGEAQQAKIMDALTTADLSSYISNPTEERMASLETWICNQLEDEGFLELCRDVEGIWQRIAFGR